MHVYIPANLFQDDNRGDVLPRSMHIPEIDFQKAAEMPTDQQSEKNPSEKCATIG